MRIIVDRYRKANREDEYPMITTCDNCGSDYEIEYDDTYIGALGCRYVKCPCCGHENMMDDGIQLTKDNLKFPDHYFSFANGVKISDEAVDRDVKRCIEALRNSKDKRFYATRAGTGDTHIFVFRYDGDEEYFVYVGKGGYETNVPFEDVDYR